jgi:hypothetical protein
MKKVMYTILSVLSIIYIVFLALHVIRSQTAWDPNMGWFAKWFDLIVNFGGIAIIFCFALVNFAGSPLKTVFFILLIAAIVLYVIVLATQIQSTNFSQMLHHQFWFSLTCDWKQF